MEIYLHTRPNRKADWENRGVDFKNLLRLPTVGEYVSLSNDEGNNDWHRVDLVVHAPFQTEYVAEIYCTACKSIDVLIALGNPD